REDAGLVIAQSGGHEPLRAHRARLALILLRDEVEVGLRDFDIEPEDLVVADLQRLDPGSLLLRRLHRGDGSAPALGELGQLVEIGAEARTHESGRAVTSSRRTAAWESSSTASCRVRIAVGSISGAASQRESSLPPAAVSVRS